ncbi:hypothetical protein GU700_21635 [Methylobacterium sp. NI91]|nr:MULTISPECIES: hypothetical protein [unclassified Methylobacterium]QIJ76950.1 hypothetical protein CLZ_21630 [Methylobacterium sp. CLZ]QIJ81854.1 hypothetical protein GU700_21635 [Methylobacterium sp. NI91]
MGYDFTKLGSKLFEELVQAIALKALGNGTVIYGSGPDGAREATFQGKVPFPSETENWDGYIVVQAKYREKNDTKQSDAAWLINQLKSEAKKFTSTAKNLKRPQFYIIATNVDLSSVSTRTNKKTGKLVTGGARK